MESSNSSRLQCEAVLCTTANHESVVRALEKANQEYRNIWQKYSCVGCSALNKLIKKPPIQYPNVVFGNSESNLKVRNEVCKLVVFVGLNPSDSGNVDDYPLSNNGQDDEYWQKVLDHDTNSYYNHKYYVPYREAAHQYKLCWVHLDLFAYRMTRSAETKQSIDRNLKCGSNEGSFYSDQTKVLIETLCAIKPNTIVITNTLVRDVLQGEYLCVRDMKMNGCSTRSCTENSCQSNPRGIICKCGKKDGSYHASVDCLSGIPIHASGMLSGQRALDTDSRERLFTAIVNSMKSEPYAP